MVKTTKYKVGMIVEHPKRPAWGPGKVIALGEGRIHVVFRDDLERVAKAILTTIINLDVAEAQTDTILDVLPAAKLEGGNWVLPKNFERIVQRAVGKAANLANQQAALAAK
jgi:hypothetical protein